MEIISTLSLPFSLRGGQVINRISLRSGAHECRFTLARSTRCWQCSGVAAYADSDSATQNAVLNCSLWTRPRVASGDKILRDIDHSNIYGKMTHPVLQRTEAKFNAQIDGLIRLLRFKMELN